jgi:hypothetical protein
MDPFTRKAVIGSGILLGLLVVLLVPWDRLQLRPRIWQLDEILQKDPVLASYPYRFRAVQFLNGIVTLTRPYDSEVPAILFLTAMDPTLANKPADSADAQAAFARLSEHEMQAIGVMRAQPDVESVDWMLDRAWLDRHHIDVPDPQRATRPGM